MTALTSKKSTRDDENREGLRLLAKTNLFRLAREILKYDDMTEGFHLPMALWSQTQPIRKKLHMVPRGHFKTSCLTIAKNIQRILNDPNVRILIASNKAENAEAMLAELKAKLADDFMVWLFPEILVKDPEKNAERWTTGQITVKRTRKAKEPTIDTNGVEGELVSRHYEVGTFDDLVGRENSQTRPERQKVIGWFQAAQSLVDQPAPDQAWFDIIGTPWDADDLYADLLKKHEKGDVALGVYKVPCWVPDPNGVEVTGYGKVRLTFPERFTLPALLALRKPNAAHFSAQYLLSPVDDTDAVFKRVLPDEKHPYGIPVIKPRRDAPAIQTMWLAMTIDPAISVKGWNDHTAITVCGWDHENQQHVLWLRWGKWEPTQLIEETYLAYNHFAAKGNAPAIIGFETVAFQRLFLHLFTSEGQKRDQFLPIKKLERDTKNTKQTRQLVLEPGWNAGEIVLYDDLDALDDLLDMAAKFRPHKELTRDDLLDVLADNHQLRIRPHAPDPSGEKFSHLEPEVAERARYMHDAQEQRKAESLAPLDDASLRVSWDIRRRIQQMEEARQAVVVGVGEDY